MKTKIPAGVRVVLLLLVMVAVFGMMLICSIWNFPSPDPYPAQKGWLAVGDLIGLPAMVLPKALPGGLQFLMVYVFWVTLGYFLFSLPFRFALESSQQDSNRHRGDFLAEELGIDLPQNTDDSKSRTEQDTETKIIAEQAAASDRDKLPV